jgi:hypothetical protein
MISQRAGVLRLLSRCTFPSESIAVARVPGIVGIFDVEHAFWELSLTRRFYSLIVDLRTRVEINTDSISP